MAAALQLDAAGEANLQDLVTDEEIALYTVSRPQPALTLPAPLPGPCCRLQRLSAAATQSTAAGIAHCTPPPTAAVAAAASGAACSRPPQRLALLHSPRV